MLIKNLRKQCIKRKQCTLRSCKKFLHERESSDLGTLFRKTNKLAVERVVTWELFFARRTNLLDSSFLVDCKLLYKKKNTPCDFLFDEIDVTSYFFHNFLYVYVVQNRVLRLSKGLFRETYSIKSLLLVHRLRIKAINLLLSYT